MKASLALLLVLSSTLLPSPDFVVHEWGTFTSVAGEDGTAVDWDALGCGSDLPRFVNDFGYRDLKFRMQGTVRMETPVLYFYSPREIDARVKVRFPQGVLTEWYPQADHAILRKSYDGTSTALPQNLAGIDMSLRTMTGALDWKSVRVQPGSTPVMPFENQPSRYYAARATDADAVDVGGQHEKFLFYRGLGRFPVPLNARVAANGKVAVESRLIDSVSNVILFSNRGGRVGFRMIGAVGKAVTVDLPALDSSLPQLRHDLETALRSQGLYAKEAAAMLETWHDSWFEEGTRLFYIVPGTEVDRILPLEVTPTPSKSVRVFVGRIELITPDMTEAVKAAAAKSDWRALARYDRFLTPILNRAYPGDTQKIGDIQQSVRRARGYSPGSNLYGCSAPLVTGD